MTANERANGRPRAHPEGSERDGPDGDESLCRRRRWTTIVLEERSGGWRATQTGVASEGFGPIAADAAAAYCQRIAGTGDEDAGRRDASSRESAR